MAPLFGKVYVCRRRRAWSMAARLFLFLGRAVLGTLAFLGIAAASAMATVVVIWMWMEIT